jgi:hypothetical protein
MAAVVILLGMGQAERAYADSTFAHLILNSKPGSFIGEGKNWDITYTPANTGGFFNAQILTFADVSGQPAFLRFSFLQLGSTPDNYSTLDFATNQLGIPIGPGTYTNAQRASFATAGHPGLDVTIQHEGANTLTGSFTITSLSFFKDTSGTEKIGHFAVTFSEDADNHTSQFTGSFEYNDAGASSTPEPSSLVLLGASTLLGFAWRRKGLVRGTP